MRSKSLSTPLVVALIAMAVAISGLVLYRGVTGGQVGDGQTGRVVASPPMPEAAKQQMVNQATHRGNGSVITP